MGVITVTDIDYGQIFGPFPSHVTPADPAYLIGMLTNDKRPEGIVLKMDPGERREGLRAVDWLPYIQPARDSEEQNMEAYVKEGQVYFRTLRIVRAGEELLVWYSKDFAQLLNIPELPRPPTLEGEQFICSRCGDTFDFPYPLRAHIKFKCSYTLNELSSSFSTKAAGGRAVTSDSERLRMTSKSFPPTEPVTLGRSSADTHKGRLDTQNERQSARSFHGFGEAKCSSPLRKRLHLEPGSSHMMTSSSSSSKVPRLTETKLDRRSPMKEDHVRVLAGLDRSPRRTPEGGSKELQNDVASAFRKVERSASPDVERSSSAGSSRATEDKLSLSPVSSSTLTAMTLPASLPLPVHGPPRSVVSSKACVASSAAAGLPSMHGSLMGLYMPRLPLVPPTLGLPAAAPLHHVSAHHPAFAAVDQIPPGLLEMCRATIPSIGPLTESFANIRNGDGDHSAAAAVAAAAAAGFPGKAGMFMGGGGGGGTGDRHSGMSGPSPGSMHFLKSNNPMVEKILQSTAPTLSASPLSALNISQNWCAKCNATFRMTSDLVYHMRSHHKREFDPMKRKREEKLKCTICNESFRERHHLTRHMSSHA
ncbi:PR domain zinc finger protein 8-like isoform X2 [Pomacea canaliculata]|nr:PR domain zinc finger protein 8-like isoform X2 [Pomacea canaliculata]XP_025111424.1 PR domain zinc finger protein 8-like isoform X2 [Pomacea canaliculata]XP_025111432.1 PR domain zinc finger protein 8-like isoform X2 [Pomacea canaliculata]